MKYKKGQIIKDYDKKWKIISVSPHKHPISKKVNAHFIQARNIKKDEKLGSYSLSFWSDKPVTTSKVNVTRKWK